MEDCKQKMGFNLLGYVVMGNHYHLILRTGSRPLSMIMHAINGSYSRHYNWKYDRSGHVFQGRYVSAGFKMTQ
ncbi:transposase [Desulforudis sp. 1031]|uniref:transposase n=1 Tax=Desulforudis sp. 1031 TaxID=3416138 RepID=UPI003CF26A28